MIPTSGQKANRIWEQMRRLDRRVSFPDAYGLMDDVERRLRQAIVDCGYSQDGICLGLYMDCGDVILDLCFDDAVYRGRVSPIVRAAWDDRSAAEIIKALQEEIT